MIVFQCSTCDKIPCMIICESDADVPEFCPWDGTYEADWNMMREQRLKGGAYPAFGVQAQPGGAPRGAPVVGPARLAPAGSPLAEPRRGTDGGRAAMTYPITCPRCGSRRVSVENFWADYDYTIPIPGRDDRGPVVKGAWFSCWCQDCRVGFEVRATGFEASIESTMPESAAKDAVYSLSEGEQP